MTFILYIILAWFPSERLAHRPLMQSIENITVPIGGRATFACRYHSDPHPYLIWIKHTKINGSYYDKNENPYFEQIQVGVCSIKQLLWSVFEHRKTMEWT